MMFELILLTFPIQSFVVSHLIKGLTIFNVLVIAYSFKIFVFDNKKNRSLTKKMVFFAVAFLGYFFLAQLSEYFFGSPIKKPVIFVSGSHADSMLFRKSFFTQSCYLFVVVAFFFILLDYLKNHGIEKVIRLSFLAVTLFIIYGYIEFFMYLIYQTDVDFISNRITGDNYFCTLFQEIEIRGRYILRMNSLTPEASMYALTVLPFTVFSVYLKKYKFTALGFISLVLSTSTSAVLGIVLFLGLDLTIMKHRLKKMVVYGILAGISIAVFHEYFFFLFENIMGKISLNDPSSIARLRFATDHFMAWADSSLFNMIFGHGFGYARSTDGLTTLLFNTGLVGLLIYCLFFIAPYYLIRKKSDYIKGLFIANVSMLIVILISVSEFYYPHIWIFNALLWVEYLKEKEVLSSENRQILFVNARFLTQKITGVQRFAIEISKELKTIYENGIRFVTPGNIVNRKVAEELGAEVIGINKGHIWEQIDLPLFLKHSGAPVLLNLANTAPLVYKNKLVTVYDLAFFHHPEWFSRPFSMLYNFLIPRICRNSRFIFTDSHFVKNDIAGSYTIEKNKIKTVYGACSHHFRHLELERENFVLAVGSLDPRKNLHLLIDIFKQLSDVNLMIVGQKSKVFADIDDSGLPENITFTGFLDDEELVKLYNKAMLFVYPSSFEGFGMPPLEAQACGCPVVCSNAASLPEVLEDSVLYCNPEDPDDILKSIKQVLEDRQLRESLVKKGFENVKRFSWKQSAESMNVVLKEFL